jgi:hypothetical protein
VTRSLVGALQSPLQRVDLVLKLKFLVVFLCVWIISSMVRASTAYI